jgi:hypothetical protein
VCKILVGNPTVEKDVREIKCGWNDEDDDDDDDDDDDKSNFYFKINCDSAKLDLCCSEWISVAIFYEG